MWYYDIYFFTVLLNFILMQFFIYDILRKQLSLLSLWSLLSYNFYYTLQFSTSLLLLQFSRQVLLVDIQINSQFFLPIKPELFEKFMMNYLLLDQIFIFFMFYSLKLFKFEIVSQFQKRITFYNTIQLCYLVPVFLLYSFKFYLIPVVTQQYIVTNIFVYRNVVSKKIWFSMILVSLQYIQYGLQFTTIFETKKNLLNVNIYEQYLYHQDIVQQLLVISTLIIWMFIQQITEWFKFELKQNQETNK